MATDERIWCRLHGREVGYIVCRHVLSGSPVTHLAMGTPEKAGELLCAACLSRLDKVTDDELTCICGCCARERGYIPQSTVADLCPPSTAKS
jgi:hypothetical protein